MPLAARGENLKWRDGNADLFENASWRPADKRLREDDRQFVVGDPVIEIVFGNTH